MKTVSTTNLTETVTCPGQNVRGQGGNKWDEEDEEGWQRRCRELYDFYEGGGHLGRKEKHIDEHLAKHELNMMFKPKPKSRYELGAREFTLTYSPKWFDDTEARRLMEVAVHKLMKYYKDEIIQLRAVGEVGTNGLSHVHCFYKLKSGLKMTDKNFKRAWSYWNPKKKIGRGFEGGHHANVREESDFLGYIDKDADTAWLDELFSQEET